MNCSGHFIQSVRRTDINGDVWTIFDNHPQFAHEDMSKFATFQALLTEIDTQRNASGWNTSVLTDSVTEEIMEDCPMIDDGTGTG